MRVPALLLVLLALAEVVATGCGGPDDPQKALADACERQREQVAEEHDSGSTKEAKSTEEFTENEQLVECAGQESLVSEAAGAEGEGSGEEDKDTEADKDAEAGAETGEDAGADDSKQPALDDTMLAAERTQFSTTCASCHALADAKATGAVGPDLDESSLDQEEIREQIENGGGGMPPKLLTGDDADAMAAYVAQVSGG